MMKSGLACCVFTMAVIVTQAVQDQPNTEKNNPVTLKYLGAAGWEITDGTTARELLRNRCMKQRDAVYADVIDETPAAYKSIESVMAAQADLVEIVHTLRQVVCVKG